MHISQHTFLARDMDHKHGAQAERASMLTLSDFSSVQRICRLALMRLPCLDSAPFTQLSSCTNTGESKAVPGTLASCDIADLNLACEYFDFHTWDKHYSCLIHLLA